MEKVTAAPVQHRRRKHRKYHKLKRRILVVSLMVLVFAAWAFLVIGVTRYFGKKGDLGHKPYEIDPAGFDKTQPSHNPY